MNQTPLIRGTDFERITGLTRRQYRYWADRDLIRFTKDGYLLFWAPVEVLRAVVVRRIHSVARGYVLPPRIADQYLTRSWLVAGIPARTPKRARKICLYAASTEKEAIRLGVKFAGGVVIIPVGDYRTVISQLTETGNGVH
jgi:hypothetical protein